MSMRTPGDPPLQLPEGAAPQPNGGTKDEPQMTHEAAISALTISLEALEKSNSKLREAMDAEWSWAKGLLVITAGVIALIFGSNFYREYIAVSELKEKATKLDEQITKTANIAGDLNKKFTETQAELQQLAGDVKQSQREAFQATNAALHVLSIIDLSRDQLVYRRNPQRALHYASEAEQHVQKALITLSEKSPFRPILLQMRGPIQTIQAECAWQLAKTSRVAEIASRLISDGHESLEAYFYDGLAKLDLAMIEETDKVKQRDFLRLAIASLQKAVNLQQGPADRGLAQLFLAAAGFQAGQYATAIQSTDELLAGYPAEPEKRTRLPKEVQAQIVLASAWRSLAGFASAGQRPLQVDTSCTIDVGSIGEQEARLLERLLVRITRDKGDRFTDAMTGYEASLFCADVIGLLRSTQDEAGRVEKQAPAKLRVTNCLQNWMSFPLCPVTSRWVLRRTENCRCDMPTSCQRTERVPFTIEERNSSKLIR